MKVLFWNVGKLRDTAMAARLCVSTDADIFLLAECPVERSDIRVGMINELISDRFFHRFEGGYSSIVLLTRYPSFLIRPISDNARYSVREVLPPASQSIIITSVHLPSKMHATPEDQYYNAKNLRFSIEEAEAKIGHDKTMVIGDFNVDPFEHAMVAADGMNAVMDMNMVKRASREIDGRRWSSFYNPMWSLLGDKSRGPSGTYFYSKGHVISYFWHMFDQVIIRPSLIPFFDHDKLEIHAEENGLGLLRNRIINRDVVDHLPISVQLNVEGKLS